MRKFGIVMDYYPFPPQSIENRGLRIAIITIRIRFGEESPRPLSYIGAPPDKVFLKCARELFHKFVSVEICLYTGPGGDVPGLTRSATSLAPCQLMDRLKQALLAFTSKRLFSA